LGVDFGTSGARATLIDEAGNALVETRQQYGEGTVADLTANWKRALYGLVTDIPEDLRASIVSIAIDGTSSTCHLMDEVSGQDLTTPLMYNDACTDALPEVASMAPAGHTVVAATSTLCKLVHWQQNGQIPTSGAPRLVHQADWLGYLLHQQCGVSDYNNSLKLGFDPAPGVEAFPDWMQDKAFSAALPARVVAPGEPVARVAPEVARTLGLPASAMVCGGTTDSIAAFLAAGVTKPGQAVTSLGSTLALKLLSTTRLDNAESGIYSHRLGDMWLVGGASNTGGAILRTLFTDEQLAELSKRIDPLVDSGLDYYPLMKPGERFPINDATLEPRMGPRPDDDAMYLHGILESIAKIEGLAFKLFDEQGASTLTEVYTAGGGASNETWSAMRSRVLRVPVYASPNVEASYGAAILARQSFI